jgi:hypothetical protein
MYAGIVHSGDIYVYPSKRDDSYDGTTMSEHFYDDAGNGYVENEYVSVVSFVNSSAATIAKDPLFDTPHNSWPPEPTTGYYVHVNYLECQLSDAFAAIEWDFTE